MDYYESLLDCPCLTTIHTELERMELTHKKVTRYNNAADPVAQDEHYERMKSINVMDLVDVDGANQNPQSFRDTYGRAPRGEECIFHQIILNDKAYGVYAAHDYQGFSFWKIYEGNCSSPHVIDFLTDLRGYLKDDKYLLLDNASNQKSRSVTECLEQLYPDHHVYVPGYSPRLKPIERGFSNVKRYIRKYEYTHRGEYDPVTLINEAFEFYSFRGEGSSAGTLHCTSTIVLD